jgi:dipeptidyl aminopeptidase/acylaminoacyl peptidase
MKAILSLLSLVCLSACSFNGVFLQPLKLPENLQHLKLMTDTDTTYYNFTLDAHQPKFLKNDQDSIALDFTIESVMFKSANGNNLNGWMLKPKNADPKITLLHFHGNGGLLLSQYDAITPLLKYGFQIFLFDYSGFGFSEGEATRDNVLIDGNSALTYLKSRNDVKNTKLVIYGQSLGGHLSAVVAQQRQNEIDGLVVEGAFSSHKDIAANRATFFASWIVSEKYSAYESIQEYKKPVLIIHSTEDNIVPFEMGQKLFAKANPPKEFYELNKCHICGPRYYADSIAAKIKNMLK